VVGVDETPPIDEIAELRATPVTDVLATHIFYLIQVAAVHLAATPANLEDAALIIDVVGAILAAGGERLGEHVELYRNALAEVQRVYVRAATL
jgi:hypothetical protein